MFGRKTEECKTAPPRRIGLHSEVVGGWRRQKIPPKKLIQSHWRTWIGLVYTLKYVVGGWRSHKMS